MRYSIRTIFFGDYCNCLIFTPFDGDGFKFTSAGIFGRVGPNKETLIAHYDNEWTENTKLFDFTKRGLISLKM